MVNNGVRGCKHRLRRFAVRPTLLSRRAHEGQLTGALYLTLEDNKQSPEECGEEQTGELEY